MQILLGLEVDTQNISLADEDEWERQYKIDKGDQQANNFYRYFFQSILTHQ